VASCVWNARQAGPGAYAVTVEFETGPFAREATKPLTLTVEGEEDSEF
jgi:hypothetical protein